LVVAKNGNDTTKTPYLTVNAAIADVTSGQTVWIMPGTYAIEPFTLPENTCLRGLNSQTVKLEYTTEPGTPPPGGEGVVIDPATKEAAVILITMGDNCRIEDVNIKLP
jgi:pectin methylesterase-like acyl-CoA thioesterase